MLSWLSWPSIISWLRQLIQGRALQSRARPGVRRGVKGAAAACVAARAGRSDRGAAHLARQLYPLAAAWRVHVTVFVNWLPVPWPGKCSHKAIAQAPRAEHAQPYAAPPNPARVLRPPRRPRPPPPFPRSAHLSSSRGMGCPWFPANISNVRFTDASCSCFTVWPCTTSAMAAAAAAPAAAAASRPLAGQRVRRHAARACAASTQAAAQSRPRWAPAARSAGRLLALLRCDALLPGRPRRQQLITAAAAVSFNPCHCSSRLEHTRSRSECSTSGSSEQTCSSTVLVFSVATSKPVVY